ncbi:DUF7535 family protein [Halocatena pleomorpha]|uniref:Uncharacterized protein n=1 Tax=Halocatena pleomorpha TaxID=1785090 RepID=A0A3P3R6Q8_9EURY|nr:hypothetical protein [Halocatena pleomorpha]RRJ28330.1 hypothetical protein EIK79_15925 [Halocatena pleomorpha]
MSTDEESETGAPTVTPEYFGRPDREMDVIGWVIFLGLVVLLIPLSPFLILIWVVGRLTNRATSRRRE